MKRSPISQLHLFLVLGGAICAVLVGCASTEPAPSNEPATPGSFASVRPILESTCVHCHGKERLPSMAAFDSTDSLALLIGPGKWISPGHPETSRFFQVVTYGDDQVGAMPPTGHAISKAQVETLRAWIKGGAPLPAGRNVRLTPSGDIPRSR